MTNTLVLHPIQHGFTNDNGGPKHVYAFTPDHLPWLFRVEYKFCRLEGMSRRASRWHVLRMIAMIHNPFDWSAEWIGDEVPGDDAEFAAEEGYLNEVAAQEWMDAQQ